jgi:hypothetical protein
MEEWTEIFEEVKRMRFWSKDLAHDSSEEPPENAGYLAIERYCAEMTKKIEGIVESQRKGSAAGPLEEESCAPRNPTETAEWNEEE